MTKEVVTCRCIKCGEELDSCRKGGFCDNEKCERYGLITVKYITKLANNA
jgi:hypothetical protein